MPGRRGRNARRCVLLQRPRPGQGRVWGHGGAAARKRAFGVDRDHTQRKVPGKYDAVEVGLNYRMSELQAALGLAQVARLPEILSRRREHFARLQGLSRRDARRDAARVLELVDLSDRADQRIRQLSHGMRRRVATAQAFLGDPELILLDEPAAGVNPVLTGTLIDKIKELNRQGTTFVIIEHDMDFVMQHCDPVIALAEGRVVFQGTSEEALANPVLLDAYLGAKADG